MKYRVVHTTSYQYETPISVSHNRVTLTPRESRGLRCLWHRLTVHPAPSWSIKRHDYFGNLVHVFGIEEGHSQLTVTAASQVEILPPVLPLAAATPPWSWIANPGDWVQTDEQMTTAAFRYRSPRITPSERFRAYAQSSFPPDRPVLEAALELNARLHDDFQYDEESTDVHTSVEQAFELRRGVCQDFAQVQIALFRSMGLPARYVSGYLRTLPPPGQERLVGADQSHAWVALYCGPEAGWIDLDPTNRCLGGPQHVPIAWGRDYSDVVPFRGVFLGEGRHHLEVSVDVSPMTDSAPAGEHTTE
jgi:transglutaminase-like putative cysteine protease